MCYVKQRNVKSQKYIEKIDSVKFEIYNSILEYGFLCCRNVLYDKSSTLSSETRSALQNKLSMAYLIKMGEQDSQEHKDFKDEIFDVINKLRDLEIIFLIDYFSVEQLEFGIEERKNTIGYEFLSKSRKLSTSPIIACIFKQRAKRV